MHDILRMYPPPAAAPPLNVQATQASASTPVEVSCSPPSGGVSIDHH